jgi:16S rRNA C967 or C1407 C5-methylase (RsmB/RsmF family)/NOL1/NOP2/fmu family ribosome biogenesis protein
VQLPVQLLNSLEGIKGFDREAFEKVHSSGEQITSIRFNPAKPLLQFSNFPIPISKIPRTENGYYLAERPSFTFDPFFHAGCYYVQEASSMFLEQALKQTVDLSQPLKVLDLCAAPGGKSTHIQSLISKESLLVSNELIRSRVNILKDNIIKWGCENVVVTNNDPKDFTRLENYFDVIVVDAPCSGSGLFRRDPGAIKEWSESNVQLCAQRQQRILADVFPALKKDGVLMYSTCSYSAEENEEIVDWLLATFPLQYATQPVQPEWGITDTGKGYRFWPDKVKGEGFFLACFQKMEDGNENTVKSKMKVEQLNKIEMNNVSGWVQVDGRVFIKWQNHVFAWPEKRLKDFSLLSEKLNIRYSGVQVGELMHDKLVPVHALAMSRLLHEKIPKAELSYDDAILYLKKKDVPVKTLQPGWHVAAYGGISLGWMNVLANRINNYYPKSLRILKER